jgi:hypothetical protein
VGGFLEMSELLFNQVNYTVTTLVQNIELGTIGLPDIQRPFVWPTAKIRDLFDSMYKGYPIGYLLFWENGFQDEHKHIGVDHKQTVPTLLIVDGQQRLTSLYAVIKAVPVVDKDFRVARIRIAFNPLEERFEVTNPAIEQDIRWIPDISILWSANTDTFAFITDYMQHIKAANALSAEEEKKIPTSINNLIKLTSYPITALVISPTVSEEDVAEIFVRINSKGTPLNQADFILTLMSVFWDDGRKELEVFCRQAKIPPSGNKATPFNFYFHPSPDQLLRVSVALGFRRARLEYVYSLLRGKDLQTGEFSAERRDQQFEVLKDAQAYVLNLDNWHEFFRVILSAGYVNGQLISSEMAIIYSYALWLIGKRDFKVDNHDLRRIIAKWFFMSSLTGRYSSSAESRMEQDLALLRNANTAREFIDILEGQINAVLTSDYWSMTLPNELESAAPRSTSQYAYFASLVLLEAPVLYSKLKVRELLSPGMKGNKQALERHHLFPRRYLEKIGIRDLRTINQVANYDLIEWSDNIDISDQPPFKYVPEYEKLFSPQDLAKMYDLHGLWERWYEVDYSEFLKERRQRIAEVIRRGFENI